MKLNSFRYYYEHAVKIPICVVDDITPIVNGDDAFLKDQRVSDTTYSYVYLETDTCGGQIIYLGICKLVPGKERQLFSEYIDPGYALSDKKSSILKIYPLDFSGAKSRDQVIKEAYDFISDSVIVADPYEYYSLMAAFKEIEKPLQSCAWINLNKLYDHVISIYESSLLFDSFNDFYQTRYYVQYYINTFDDVWKLIMQHFTLKGIIHLSDINTRYQRVQEDIYLSMVYAIVHNKNSFSGIMDFAAKLNYDMLREKYASFRVPASKLSELSKYVPLGIEFTDSEYTVQKYLYHNNGPFIESIGKNLGWIAVDSIHNISEQICKDIFKEDLQDLCDSPRDFDKIFESALASIDKSNTTLITHDEFEKIVSIDLYDLNKYMIISSSQ